MALKIAILQSNYIPWKGYFDIINRADILVLYDDMQFTKRDWRNRNRIQTYNGLQWLTIPVIVKGRYLQKIKAQHTREKARKNWPNSNGNRCDYRYCLDSYNGQYFWGTL